MTQTSRLVTGLLLGAWPLVACGSAVLAEDQPSAAQIIEALKPKPGVHTRALMTQPNPDQARALLSSLRNRQTRMISIEERTKVSEIAATKPKIALEIPFDYNSDAISSKATPILVSLGTALRSGDLQDRIFLVSGHTDAKGDDAYNQTLSERRAEAIKQYLVERFSLRPENLIPIGYGKTQLKNTADPFGEENRRVEIVNTELK